MELNLGTKRKALAFQRGTAFVSQFNLSRSYRVYIENPGCLEAKQELIVENKLFNCVTLKFWV